MKWDIITEKSQNYGISFSFQIKICLYRNSILQFISNDMVSNESYARNGLENKHVFLARKATKSCVN